MKIPRSYSLRCLFLLGLLCLGTPLFAQAAPAADFMRSMGKMYVVVGVIVLVFLGLVFFVWRMDRRLTKLEDQTNQHVQ